MSTVKESTNDLIRRRKEYLEEAYKAAELVEQLPPEIQEMTGTIDCDFLQEGNHLTVHVYGTDTGQVLKLLGIQGLKLEAGYSKYLSLIGGKFNLPDGTEVSISAHGIDTPPNCTLEPYTEEVTKYKVTCPEMQEA